MGELRRLAGIGVLVAIAVCGCSRTGGGGRPPSSLPSDALDSAIGGAIGDPTTCVLVADQTSGRVLYQYGEKATCRQAYPACDRPGTLTAAAALPLANGGHAASCAVGGANAVGWAENQIPGARRPLVYSAVMDGPRALPGHEMAARLGDVFSKVPL